MSAAISSRNGILATTHVAQAISRSQAERAERAVFTAVPAEDRWQVMCMLFQPPRPSRTGADGKRIYGRD